MHQWPSVALYLPQNAIVRRVDNALGLLLELPASSGNPSDAEEPDTAVATAGSNERQRGKGGRKGARQRGAAQAGAAAANGGQAAGSAAGYAHISAVSDTRVEKLDKASVDTLHSGHACTPE